MTNEEYRKMRGTDKPFIGKKEDKPGNKLKMGYILNDKKMYDESWDLKCPHCKFELIKPNILTCPNCQRETGFVEEDND